ncbi:conserved hypothetical protein [Alteromonas macleodii]|uniref:Uncharacterized protein n=1 Tax=Alteromonas macleodii TaxID=28108 RepID=A0AB36FPS6_ALTMA|nr:hypothetical protein BFV95_3773 [Alteromonas macleodii]OES27504.1 hypothetical protein BFV94_3768 [Alteromonas macleodii]OES27621.1 hypothetical protein BFV93_3763 [Alteromonas macleodii]OES39711.1 hypothetical protein BFV96_3757 [Alteromonas macleodii]
MQSHALFIFLREATLVQVTLFALPLLIHVAQRATFKNRAAFDSR